MASAQERGDGEELGLVLEYARSAVDQEFKIAERLEAKARNQLAVAGPWFAAVQGIAALGVRALVDNGDTDSFTFIGILLLAGAGAACLIVAMFFSYRVWRLQPEKEITHEALDEMAAVARDPDKDLAKELVQHYKHVLARRRANNHLRGEAFDASVRWWIAAVVFGLLQLALSLFAIAQS